MKKYYLKMAWRNMQKHRLYSFLALTALVVGLTSSLFIYLWISFEKSYDTFHEKSDRIALVQAEHYSNEQFATYSYHEYPMSEALKTTYNEIEETVISVRGELKVDEFESPLAIWATQSHFFSVFDFPFLYGTKEQALDNPNDLVLSYETAVKLFGEGVNPVGREISVKTKPYKITGVLKALPENTMFRLDLLINLNQYTKEWYKGWMGGYGYNVFALFRKGVDMFNLQEHIKAEQYLPSEILKKYREYAPKVRFMPLEDLHTHSIGFGLQITDDVIEEDILNIFIWIGFVILGLSLIVYINLSVLTQRSYNKELGIRKVTGAETKDILIQQFFNTGLVYGIALIGTLVLLEIGSPFVSVLIGKPIEWSIILGMKHYFFLGILLFVVVFISGAYPVWAQRKWGAVDLIRSNQKEKMGMFSLSQGLTLFQLGTSIMLVISTLVVYSQFRFMLEKPQGIASENLVSLFSEEEESMLTNVFTLRESLLALPEVKSATFSNAVFQGGHYVDGYGHLQKDGKEIYIDAQVRFVEGEQFAQLFDMEFVEGRNFDDQLETDKDKAIVNEALLKQWNWKKAVGKTIARNGKSFEIIGVVKDFHIKSVREPISPLIIRKDDVMDKYLCLTLKLHRGDWTETVEKIRKVYKELYPLAPFKLGFHSEMTKKMYEKEKRLLSFFLVLSLISITISMLGVFSLTGLSLKQRDKEIAVRKTYGAEVSDLLWLLFKRYLYMLMIAFVLGIPILLIYLPDWLEKYTFHIALTALPFIEGLFITLFCIALTVFYHLRKSIKLDPVEALKVE